MGAQRHQVKRPRQRLDCIARKSSRVRTSSADRIERVEDDRAELARVLEELNALEEALLAYFIQHVAVLRRHWPTTAVEHRSSGRVEPMGYQRDGSDIR